MAVSIARKGMLLIISGPSGAGKGTLVKKLLSSDPSFRLSCSVTTRQPREGEIEGVHYYFIDDAKYAQLVEENAFLEHASVHGHSYGTLREPVEKMISEGLNVVLEIDPQGALSVMENASDYVSVFILPPSFEDLRVRLHTRNTDDPVESIGVQAARQRLETAQLVLAVFDSSQALEKEDWELMDALEKVPAIAIVNKSDLPTRMDVEAIQKRFEKTVSLSAATGEGLAALEQALSEILDTKDFHPQEGVLFTQRQRMDAQTALDSLREGEQALALGLTLDAVTVCVEDALHALAALTGEQVSEEIVDRVFEEFCVGK